jgi:hypothetical protein
MLRIPTALLLAVLLLPLAARAAEPELFQIRTAEDLVSLCAVAADDSDAAAAIHFCHGFAVGAFHFYTVTIRPSSPTEIVCLPESYPSRDRVVAEYVAWAGANPQYMQERAVDNLFRFLGMKYPCTK